MIGPWQIQGPAIIREFNSTTVVEPEWEASLTEMGALVLRRMVPQKKETAIGRWKIIRIL